MRELTAHKMVGVNDCLDDYIRIEVADDPGSGGAPNKYQFSFRTQNGWETPGRARVEFQSRPPLIMDGNGKFIGMDVHGTSVEALLAICVDRLQCFQLGKFNCNENIEVVRHLREALHWLHARTRDRVLRGVLGREVV